MTGLPMNTSIQRVPLEALVLVGLTNHVCPASSLFEPITLPFGASLIGVVHTDVRRTNPVGIPMLEALAQGVVLYVPDPAKAVPRAVYEPFPLPAMTVNGAFCSYAASVTLTVTRCDCPSTGSTPQANLLFTSAPTCSPPGVLATVPTAVIVTYTVAPLVQTCDTKAFSAAWLTLVALNNSTQTIKNALICFIMPPENKSARHGIGRTG